MFSNIYETYLLVVGDFGPFEKYYSNWIISQIGGEN